MIRAIKIYDLLHKRVLVTRESAKAIGGALAIANDQGEVVLDFSGVDAVTPSFVDEALAVVEKAVRANGQNQIRVVFLHPPTRLSTKFEAIGRGRGLRIKESEDGGWIITREEQSQA